MLGVRVTSDFLPHAHPGHPEITLASGGESRIYFSPVKELQTRILSQLSSPLSNWVRLKGPELPGVPSLNKALHNNDKVSQPWGLAGAHSYTPAASKAVVERHSVRRGSDNPPQLLPSGAGQCGIEFGKERLGRVEKGGTPPGHR